MHRNMLCLVLAVLLTGCGTAAPDYWTQEVPHLAAVTETLPEEQEETPPGAPETQEIRAVWIPVMQYAEWMTGRTAVQFRSSVREGFDRLQALGINTVFAHVRAYGDAYYRSELFPPGAYLTGDYDPLVIMVEEAHERGLALHAWINPLRCASPEVLSRTEETYPLRQWYDDPERAYMTEVDGRLWLDPGWPEVRALIAEGAAEIVRQYDVDGLHIDDYFYPTADERFDAASFAASGAADLGDYRRANSSALVQALYDTVKAQDERLIFSVSPQGNPDAVYADSYADALLWSSTPGYADWIVPQLYYGFANETAPFAETLRRWEESATAARLVAGLAPYKLGQPDKWAGTGSEEWMENDRLLSQEVQAVRESGAAGVAFYSYAALFDPAADAERERIREIFAEE